MSLFDQLVQQALQKNGAIAPLRPVVEKEILHHDILREMSHAGLLLGLTFIGGTCLRACYGSERLSEDLDFTGGRSFQLQSLRALGSILEQRLLVKYGLQVNVSEPIKENTSVTTWKIKIITRPEQKDMPMQRINLDICAIPSYDRQPVMLRNYYGIDMGTSGLIIQAQSREEILADKLVALAFRPNRIKNRDLWDIVWLKQQGVVLPLCLLPDKVKDHKQQIDEFLNLLKNRATLLEEDAEVHKNFIFEMRRFLPVEVVGRTVVDPDFWIFLTDTVRRECLRIIEYLQGKVE